MKLLLIEDNEDHVALFMRSLKDSSEELTIFHAESMAEGEGRLRNGEVFDAILLDISLPDGEGTENIRRLEDTNSDIPIVVLTSLDDQQTASTALKVGAQDYLVKDKVTKATLNRSLRYAIQRQSVRVENQRLVEQLKAAQELMERKNKRLRKLYETPL